MDSQDIPPNEIAHRRRVNELTSDIHDLIADVADRVLELHEMGVPVHDWYSMLVRLWRGNEMMDALVDSQPLQTLVPAMIEVMLTWSKSGADDRVAAAMRVAERLLGTDFVAMIAADNVGGAAKKLGFSDGAAAAANALIRPTHVGELPDCHVRIMATTLDRLFAAAPKMRNADGSVDETQAPALECFICLRSGSSFQGALSRTPEGGFRLLSPNKLQNEDVLVEHFFVLDDICDVAVVRKINRGATLFSS